MLPLTGLQCGCMSGYTASSNKTPPLEALQPEAQPVRQKANLPGGAMTGGRSSPGMGPTAALTAAAAPVALLPIPVASVFNL